MLVLLGRWQWDRSQSQWGTLQNLGYAFEWWLFACLAVYGWWREMRADARAAKSAEASGSGAADGGSERASPAGVATAGLGRTAAGVHAGGPVDEVDAEVAAYNAYLSRLNARSSRQPH